ncbi:MAG TPA: redox-regulated ATPase YchF [Spirochaetales bacterium]|nr:redox-regulated ATPase YchF [Spirochaetales bacterium]HRY56005.1 redox-regulated ATPase YchF [Spirochaetia bacterium]HRZ65990.1 redox-regulated ATPase YchF [Spirochaetia bacterium]
MPLNCGIIGLPTVGKTTIFTALTRVKAETSSFSSGSKNPNLGIVAVPDVRLDKLTELFKPKRRVPATVEFVDIAGLASAASKKEGATNQMLSHIRDSALMVHVVRCFEDPEVPHVSNKVSPADDIEMLHLELALADLETIDKRAEKLQKELKDQAKKKEAERELAAFDKIRPALQEGRPARSVALDAEEAEALKRSFLITVKREIYVCNADEEGVRSGNAHIEAVKGIAAAEGAECVVICGKFEAELADLESEEEKRDFLSELGLEESGLSALIHAAYHLLGLRTFFTAGEDECRAWTIKAGDKAPAAAGVIHTDFEKGFIKAEVYRYADLEALGSEHAIKAAGKLRQEGREYVVQDGDVIFFKFNL